MNLMKYWLAIIMFIPILALSQSDTSETSIYDPVLKKYKFEKTRQSWVLKEFDVPEESIDKPDIPKSTEGVGTFVTALGYMGVMALLVLIVYMAIRYSPQKKNEILLDEEPEDFNLKKVDVVSMYDMAIQSKDYRLALRYQFLRLLKYLDLKNYIVWEKDKTNRQYANEIKQPELKERFNQLILVFEKTWYGQGALDVEGFEKANHHFEVFFKLNER